MIIILANISGCFTLSSELENEACLLFDLPYDVPEDIDEFTKAASQYFNKIVEAVKSGNSVILMYFTTLAAEILKELREEKESNASDWLILSFFHSDEELLNADITFTSEQRLNLKRREIMKILEYPFIHKVEVPYRFEITREYLIELLKIF